MYHNNKKNKNKRKQQQSTWKALSVMLKTPKEKQTYTLFILEKKSKNTFMIYIY